LGLLAEMALLITEEVESTIFKPIEGGELVKYCWTSAVSLTENKSETGCGCNIDSKSKLGLDDEKRIDEEGDAGDVKALLKY